MRRAALALVVLLAVALLAAGESKAPPAAGLSQLGRPLSGRALARASWVTVSPDGRNIYVGAERSNAVDAFVRDVRSGTLRRLPGLAGCTSEGGHDGCAAGRALMASRPIAVSGDGRNLYAGTLDGVAVFARDPRTGAIAQLPGSQGCVAEVAVEGCERGRGLSVIRAVTVARDGRHVYAAARGSDAVAIFARSASSGALRQLPGAAGCISEKPAPGCGRGRGVDGGRGVFLSRDQRFAYITAEDGNSVAVFARARVTGRLRQLPGRAGCLQRLGADGCAPLATLRSPHHLVVSSDGRFAYVASDTIGAVVTLRRNPRTGTLNAVSGRRGCIASRPRRGCRLARGFRGAHSLALSPGGRVLYVAGRNDHAIAVLLRDPRTGALTQPAGQHGCIGRIHVSSCAPAKGLRGVHSVDVSPDGRDVYAASELDDSVVSLAVLGRG